MLKEYVFYCGEKKDKTNTPEKDTRYLSFTGVDKNIHFKISDVSESMKQNVPDVFLDLLEVAAYVFIADQSAPRGGTDISMMDKNRRRKMVLHVPVRNLELWKLSTTRKALRDLLNFMSDDEYFFEFRKYSEDTPEQMYLDITVPENDTIEEVFLYSGGLDSLSGAIDEIVNKKKKVALINHFSSTKIQGNVKLLNEKFQDIRKLKDSIKEPFYIPVTLRHYKHNPNDNSQRTRSFLYMSLAATIAKMLNLNRIKVFENGIISINLPISRQLIGSKATRTAHPKTIKLASDFFSKLGEEKFYIDTPFIWLTKGDVVKKIKDAGCAELIEYSRTCSRTHQATRKNPHCGTCIQCIDRRFAVLYAQCEQFDPGEKYKVDLLIGERKEGEEKTIAESYVRFVEKLRSIFEKEFPVLELFNKFPELNKVSDPLKDVEPFVYERIVELYTRFSNQINSVLKKGMNIHWDDFSMAKIPKSSIIAMTIPDHYKYDSTNKFRHSIDFASVSCNGVYYSFNTRQALVVKTLYEAYKNNTPEIHYQTLLDIVYNKTGYNTSRLGNLFRRHPAWKTLITSKKRGNYNLNICFN